MVTDLLSLDAYGFRRDFNFDRSYSAFMSFTSVVLRFGLGRFASGNVLHQLDCEVEKRGHRFARYADDMIILVKSQRAAERVMRSICDTSNTTSSSRSTSPKARSRR